MTHRPESLPRSAPARAAVLSRSLRAMAVATGCLLGLCPATRGASDARRPNVVVILADDLGYGDLGCFGHPVITTPHLDRLAAGGLKLTSCYAAMPVCSPSRAAMLTGRNPNRYGVRDWIPAGSGICLPRREITVATLMKQ